jgi:hypothetical protein
MDILNRLFRRDKAKKIKPSPSAQKRQGPLVHVFVFDSGPILQEEEKYVTNVVKSLLPEALSLPDVPVTFFQDERIPDTIGQGKSPNLKRAMGYQNAWTRIAMKNKKLVDGIRPDKERYTFSWEEYHSDWGNRGILYAFYKLID